MRKFLTHVTCALFLVLVTGTTRSYADPLTASAIDPSIPISAISPAPKGTITLGQLAAANANPAPTTTVQTQDKAVMVGAIRGDYQFGNPANSVNYRATNRGGLFLTSLGMYHALTTTTDDWNGSQATLQSMITAFQGTGPGMLEGNLDQDTTPSVPSSHWNYTQPDAWQNWNATVGWQPSIFMLNMNATGSATTTQYTTTDVQDVTTGTQDIKKSAPYVKYVLPYLSPNAGVYGTWATDAYWATARQLAIQQGGFGIDVPVGLFLINPAAYRSLVEQQIAWGVQNHLIVNLLLSPCSTNPADWTIINTCQFSADPHFMSSTQEVVRQIHNAGYDPTIWTVSQYSEQSVSPYPGTDDTTSSSYTPNATLAVADWVANNATSSPWPSAMAGTLSAGTVVTTPQMQAGNNTNTPTLGALRGIGSMAWMNSDNVSILGGSASLGSLTLTGPPTFQQNVNLVSGKSLILNSDATLTNTAFFYADLQGHFYFLSAAGSVYNGNINMKTGTSLYTSSTNNGEVGQNGFYEDTGGTLHFSGYSGVSVPGNLNLVSGKSLILNSDATQANTAFFYASSTGSVTLTNPGGPLTVSGGISTPTMLYDTALSVPTATTACTVGQVAHGKGTDGNYHEYFCYAANQWAMSPAYTTSGF